MDNEKIKLWQTKDRMGVTICKKDYDVVSAFILSLLQKKAILEIQELLDAAQAILSSSLEKDCAWYLLHVKQDLEAKGFIKITRQPNRMQFIRATRKGAQWETISPHLCNTLFIKN